MIANQKKNSEQTIFGFCHLCVFFTNLFCFRHIHPLSPAFEVAPTTTKRKKKPFSDLNLTRPLSPYNCSRNWDSKSAVFPFFQLAPVFDLTASQILEIALQKAPNDASLHFELGVSADSVCRRCLLCVYFVRQVFTIWDVGIRQDNKTKKKQHHEQRFESQKESGGKFPRTLAATSIGASASRSLHGLNKGTALLLFEGGLGFDTPLSLWGVVRIMSNCGRLRVTLATSKKI